VAALQAPQPRARALRDIRGILRALATSRKGSGAHEIRRRTKRSVSSYPSRRLPRPPSMKHPQARALALAALLTGCDNGESLSSSSCRNQVPTGGCAISSSREFYRGEGWLDLDGCCRPRPQTLTLLHPLLQKRLPPEDRFGAGAQPVEAGEGSRSTWRPRPGCPTSVSRLFTKLAADPRGRSLIEYEEPWSGSVEAGRGDVGVGGGGAGRARPPAQGHQRTRPASPTDLVRAGAGARRTAGRRQPCAPRSFVYPIRVCQGCLVANSRPCPYAPVNLGNPCKRRPGTTRWTAAPTAGSPVCPSRAVAVTPATTSPP
jgi:hypothetical protein